MTDHHPFHVAFLTNFSDTCFRAIPAMAQLCDALDVRLTLVHTHDPATVAAHTLEATLRNFFPEADRYAECRRVVLPGPPTNAITRLGEAGPLDLVIAPAGDPLGFPRLTRSSIRARLVGEAVAPVWTVGPGASAARLGRAHRHVACVVRVDTPAWEHVGRACDYARAVGATLHVVHVMPALHDGTLLRLAFAAPFDPAATAARVRAVTGRGDTTLQPHTAPHDQLLTVLDRIEADIVFVDGSDWIGRRFLTRRIHRDLDAMQRPVVCVGGTDPRPWRIEPRRHARTRRWSDAMLAPRPTRRPTSIPTPVPVPVRAVNGEPHRRVRRVIDVTERAGHRQPLFRVVPDAF